MNLFALLCIFASFLKVTHSNGPLIDTTSDIRVIVEKIASSKLIQATDKFTQLVEITKDIPADKIAKITSYIQKVKGLKKITDAVGNIAAFLGPAGPSIVFVLSLFEEDADEKLQQHFNKVFERFDAVDLKLDDISEKISTLDKKLLVISTELTLETKFAVFFKVYSDMSADFNSFDASVLSYAQDSEIFLEKLKKFTSDYEDARYEYKLLDIATSRVGSFKSMMDVLREATENYEKANDNLNMNSSSKMMFEFYLVIMAKAAEGFSLLRLCYKMQEELTQTELPGAFTSLASREDSFYKNIIKEMRVSLQSVSQDSYRNLNAQKPVRFINVLQYFWESEENLGENTCTKECGDYKDVSFSGGDGCHGRVRDCQFKYSVHHTEYQLLQTNGQTDRIYDGYSLDDKWYGKDENVGNPGASKKSWLKGFVVCHVCRCVCDQISHSRTVRKFYIGKIEAPQDHVVTGVRFKEHNKVIFLQIEVGKVLAFGLIDSGSVRWLELPEPNSGETYSFGYCSERLILGRASLDNHFITGIQIGLFDHLGPSLALKVYGKEIESFSFGKIGKKESSAIAEEYNGLDDSADKIPGLSPSSSFDIKSDIAVMFGISNEEKDAGQSFVPYFDGSDIILDTRAPLSGLGLFKFTKDSSYAGYVKPFLKTLNYHDIVSDRVTFEPTAKLNGILKPNQSYRSQC